MTTHRVYEQAGMDGAKVEKLVGKFRALQERAAFPGGQLAVWRRGFLVVNEAVGLARGLRADEGESPTAYTPETLSCVFSAGKPLVALAVAVLEQRGLLRVEDSVAKYWPEFAQHGKAEITVLDVLLHRSGLYLRELERAWRDYGDWEGLVRSIAATKPVFSRGTLAYQPMGFGWILGELVRRTTGKAIERFLPEEMLQPAGLEALPLGAREDQLATLAKSYWVDPGEPTLGGEVMTGFEQAQNSKEQLTSVLPGAGTIGTARGLARFYAWLLDGTPLPTGAPLLSPEILTRYVTPQTRGTDKTVGIPMVLGRGFALGWFWPHPYGWWRTSSCYGHAGNFSTLAWADPTTGCAIAIVTNGNRAPVKLLTRFAGIGSAVRGACVA